jgi:Flp pilus assembly protein TadB
MIIKNVSHSRPKRKTLSKRQIIGVRFERQNEVRTAFAGSVTDETHTQKEREKERDRYKRCKEQEMDLVHLNKKKERDKGKRILSGLYIFLSLVYNIVLLSSHFIAYSLFILVICFRF